MYLLLEMRCMPVFRIARFLLPGRGTVRSSRRAGRQAVRHRDGAMGGKALVSAVASAWVGTVPASNAAAAEEEGAAEVTSPVA